ncbi:DUF4340 domain-containing protein [Bythopirellula polymerisocia]|uniref:DUF4340 domain-containing protein n=1 Tax=Bythopirellula polymerisocia TaxID=2528003 RepID=A0A5C6CEK3_9BACT|nr:DUF4340 domain-containing protein [Bythopirellula polymerisocia]TWU22698.1 hypothetical protein Pla144_41580 [Bythopirellula polymerisocia]
MSEMTKTLAFVVAAGLALLAAFVVAPRENSFDVESLVGQRLNEFDIDASKRLKIIKFDPETASTNEFEVAEDNGLWSIPSKQDYPADATRQMAEAATCLIDREVLRVAASSASQHAELGVIDPTSSNLDSQAEGVGIRVVLSDNNNDVLTDMIVGKPVKDAEGQYYVRRTNQDVVYVVKLDPEKLTTKFDDWIEDDLLKINSFDIRKLAIKDYSAEMMLSLSGIQMDWDRRAEMTLTYDSDNSKWQAESIRKFDKGGKKFATYEIAEDEELNQDALKALADGLDDLLLVDVERKPAGLSDDLKAGEDFLKDEAGIRSLMMRGFAPVAIGPNKQSEILSTEGEIVTSLQDGVEYVLRFGNLQMDAETGEAKPAEGEDAATGDSINRYLFVMARFNEDMIEMPELEELPALPKDANESKESTEADSDEVSSEADETIEDPSNDEAEDTGEAASAADEPAPESEKDDSPGEAASAADDSKAESESDEATDEKAKADELADIIAARKEIEAENQRRLDEYQEKVKKGQERVAELNKRFGDWYYVISNDVYEQIHVGLDKLIKKKDADGEAASAAGEAGAEEDGVSGLPNLPLGLGKE